ncbi:MAG: hypothetical protein ABIW85_04875 [Variovorax sp.]
MPDLVEHFYAITVKRHFEPPLLKALLRQSELEVLGMPIKPTGAKTAAR